MVETRDKLIKDEPREPKPRDPKPKEPKPKELVKGCLTWILMVSVSPIAIFILISMALITLLQFLCKATLLFVIVAINTPFALLYNVSVLIFEYKSHHLFNPDHDGWNRSDPRDSVGIEVQLIVSDFFKVVAGELLVVMSTGVITFYTAPTLIFYISLAVGITATLLKWLNTKSLSKTAFSCLCDGYGFSPMMFLFSFIGLFDIGCHPIAKCSFTAKKAFLFEKNVPEKKEANLEYGNKETKEVILCDLEHGNKGIEEVIPSDFEYGNKETKEVTLCDLDGNKGIEEVIPSDFEYGNKESKDARSFNNTEMDPPRPFVEFHQWNAFERGLFNLNPRIEFIQRDSGKCILKSSMVLRLLDCVICTYPVERLELPEDYSKAKANQLYNFLVTLSKEDGFVTDKLRGRYEECFTLLQIVDGVQANGGYRIMEPQDDTFVVTTCANK